MSAYGPKPNSAVDVDVDDGVRADVGCCCVRIWNPKLTYIKILRHERETVREKQNAPLAQNFSSRPRKPKSAVSFPARKFPYGKTLFSKTYPL